MSLEDNIRQARAEAEAREAAMRQRQAVRELAEVEAGAMLLEAVSRLRGARITPEWDLYGASRRTWREEDRPVGKPITRGWCIVGHWLGEDAQVYQGSAKAAQWRGRNWAHVHPLELRGQGWTASADDVLIHIYAGRDVSSMGLGQWLAKGLVERLD